MNRPLIFVILTCCIGFIGFIGFYERHTLNELQDKVDQYSRFAEIPIWNLDEESANQYSRLIGKAGGYPSVVIYLNDGEVFVSIIDEPQMGPVDSFLASIGLIREAEVFSRIIHKGQAIGRINIVWINKNIYTYLSVALVLFLFIKLMQYSMHLVQSRRDLARNNRALQKENAERKRAERALADEKERLAVTLQSIGDGVITTDIQGKVLLVNKAAETLTGWSFEDAIGKPLDQIFQLLDEDAQVIQENPVDQVLQGDDVITFTDHMKLVIRDGTECPIVISCAPIQDSENVTIGVVLAFQDITDARRAEEERMKISRLESISLLAGGIAHDFNNDLAVILGFISIAKMNLDSDHLAYEKLKKTEEAAGHAGTLAKQLLAFARGGAPIKSLTSIDIFLNDAVGFFLSGSNVRCELIIPEDLWWADIDAGQITQVMQNLIINADHAMPDGGVITIRCKNETFGANTIVDGVHLPPGFYVRISIVDEGEGIDPDHLNRIFDPYFTTKSTGTGLGLTTAYTIVQRHDGMMTVSSIPGEGTTFEIYLPATSETPVAPEIEAHARMLEPGESQGNILIMDDDPLIRDLFEQSLTLFGFTVTSAHDGIEAIEKYKKALDDRAPFDAVIMDLTIRGGMGGKEALQQLQLLDPNVKAIVSSGYSDDPVLADYERYGFCGMVVKPFRARELSAVIHQVLIQDAV